MTRQMAEASLLFAAASSVSGTPEEVHQIQWPVCAAHGSIPLAYPLHGEELVEIIGVGWRARGGLAPVGQLTARIARTL